MRTSGSLNARGSVVWTTSTPWSSPRSMTGTPRNDRYGSSPASGKYLNRGCVAASATHCGSRLLGDQTGQALRQAHPDAADAFLPEPDRRREHEIRPIGLQEVDGTDVGREPPLNQVDDVGERFGRVPALRDEPPDLLERPEAFRRGLSEARQQAAQSKKAASSFARNSAEAALSARRRHSILSRLLSLAYMIVWR